MLADASQESGSHDPPHSTNTWHNGLDGITGGGSGSTTGGRATMSRCPETSSAPEPAASAPSPQTPSCCLTLSRTCIGAGPCENVTVKWKLPQDQVSPADWLGLYVAGMWLWELLSGIVIHVCL
ncbi:uncharacterized protein LOC134773890 [Penaeus indicus]|uniref:uncharacterized protein LOC134773890 n=1 Tax=Penaeus indicus TaxID=29960 RepID=UPI00300CDC2C